MCEGSRMMWRSNMGRCAAVRSLARQAAAAGGHNLCMKSLAKAYMDLERVRRNTAQNTAISQTGFDFNPLYITLKTLKPKLVCHCVCLNY